MKTVKLEKIDTVEGSLWWVYTTTSKGSLTHFEGDVFWDVLKANSYFELISNEV